jgi:hypothetical protein
MATLWFVKKWTHAVIPYLIDSNIDSFENFKDIVLDRIDQVHRKTLIRFVERTTEKDYVLFIGREGNVVSNDHTYPLPEPHEHDRTSDALGFHPGVTSCFATHSYTVLHEIGHVLGLLHEHQRSDRDVYIKMLIDPMNPDFIKWDTSINMSLPYDPESVMHYGITWQNNGKPAMKWIGNPDEGIHKKNGWGRHHF